VKTAIPILLFAATLSFGLGLVLPLMSVDRLYFFAREPSLVQVVASLWKGGDLLLAGVISLFSVALPAAKLALMHLAIAGEGYAVPGAHRLIRPLSRWSMLDVLLLALVIFAVRTSGLATAASEPGLWLFAASVLLSTAISAKVLHDEEAKPAR